MTSYAQQYILPIRHLNANDGMSQGYVHTMFQDSRGFMWLGTREGLNRYDGYAFKVYKKQPNDSCSLGNNEVFALTEDAQGKLWVATAGGLYRFDPVTECFKYFPDLQNQTKKGLTSIFIDAQQIIWLGMRYGGLKRFDPATQHFTFFKTLPYHVYQICENESQRYLWLMLEHAEQMVAIFDKKQKKMVTDQYSLEAMTIFKGQSRKAQNGKPYIYQLGRQKDEVIRYNPLTNEQNTFRVPWSLYPSTNAKYATFDWKNDFDVDAHETLWQTTPNGILRFDLRQRQLVAYYQFALPGLIKNTGFFVDRSGLVWIKTTGQGVYVFNPNVGQVQNFSFQEGNPNSLGFKSVRSIYEDRQGRLWVGGYTGLDVFESEASKPLHFAKQASQANPLLHGLNAESMHSDAQGRLWLGVYLAGLFRADYATHQLTPFTYKDTTIQQQFIFDIEGDTDAHTLWLATTHGLQKINTHSHASVLYKHQPKQPNSAPSGFIFSLYRDRAGTLWLGSDQGGFAKFDPVNEKFTRFVHQPHNANSLSHNSVYAMYEDQAGNFWVATAGGGLNLFDRKTLTFKHYTEKEGLANNVVNGILEDEQGNLWLSTNKGISKFDPKKETFVNFDQRDGLQANEFNRHAFCKGKDGRMYFGGVNGVSAFYPQDLKKNEFVPPVVITKFKKFNQEIPLCKLMNAEHVLELSYKDAVVSFEFAALSFYQADKNQYAYKLEGLHDEWIQLGNRRDITFPQLGAGTYTLHVKAANNAGVWNEKGITLKIKVNPPWWATNWFRLGAGLLVLLAIVGGYSWRLRQARRQRIILEKLVDERTAELKKLNHTKDRFFGIVAHDLRGPLASFQQANYTLSHYIKKQDLDKVKTVSEQMYTSAKKLNRLLNNLLDWAMVQQKSVSYQPEELHLHELVQDCLSVYQGSIALQHIQVANQVPKDQLLWADARSVTSLVQNLMGNAIKFTPDFGKIEIEVQHRDEALVLAIKDSGVGMDAATLEKVFELDGKKSRAGLRGEQGVGLGLTLCQEFARLNGARLTVESVPNEGTTFYVAFQGQNLKKTSQEIVCQA